MASYKLPLPVLSCGSYFRVFSEVAKYKNLLSDFDIIKDNLDEI